MNMRTLTRWLLPALALPLVFLGGLYLAPVVNTAWHRWFPTPEFVSGDFSALQAAAQSRVVLYATATCPYCAQVRRLFDTAGVSYREYRIDASEAADAEFRRLDGRFVPLLFIGQRRISGFREQAIRDALAALPAQ